MSALVGVGQTVQFIATANYSDGSMVDVTTKGTWNSSAPAFATVDTKGVVTGVAAGTAAITLSYQGLSSSTGVTVGSAALTSVDVVPSTASVPIGRTTILTAAGTYSDGSVFDVSTSVTWTSSNTSIATVSNSGIVIGVAAGTATISATIGTMTDAAVVTVTSAVLNGITVTPAQASMDVGLTQQFKATGQYSDGSTADVSAIVNWISSNPAVATVGVTGTATAVAVGSTTIAAVSGSVSGASVFSVTAPSGGKFTVAPTITAVAVTPATVTLAGNGQTAQLQATATLSDGTTQDVTNTVSWSSSSTAVVRVNSSGFITSVTPGSAAITAQVPGTTISGSNAVTVTAAKLVSITLAPSNPSLSGTGTTVQMTAVGFFNDGSSSVLTSATWTSSDSTVVTVNGAGLATAVGQGTATIAVMSNSISQSTTVTVTIPSLTGISVSPPNPKINSSTSVPMTAMGVFSDGSTQDITASVSWTTADPTVALVTPSGIVSGVNIGTTRVTASKSGVTGFTSVTVQYPPLASIAVSPTSVSIVQSGTTQLVATGTFTDNSTHNINSQVNWSSSNTAVATVNAAGLVTGVGPGTATISASQSGFSSSSAITVTLPPVASIAVTPANSTIAGKGTTQQMTATVTYTNGISVDGTKTATWTSSNTAVATVSAAGIVTAVTSGTTVITAVQGGVSGTTNLTVTIPTLTSIAISPAAPAVSVNSTTALTATGTYSDGSTANITTSVSWTSSITSVAVVNNQGVVTGNAAGTTTVTASSAGVSKSVTLTVNNATLISIAVAPSSVTIAPGSSALLTATGKFSDGSTRTLATGVAWTSFNTSVATVTSAGLVSGVASGTTSVSASQSGISGSASVTVSNNQLFVLPASPTLYNSDMPNTSGYTVVNVSAGQSIQNAINAASCGTIINVQAGAVYSPFKLTNHNCDPTHWIIIQSSAVANLPNQYSRVSPADVANMPSIQADTLNQPAISAMNLGTSYYRIIGLEVALAPAIAAQVANGSTPAYDFANSLIQLGGTETIHASEPHDVIVDRCYLHGTTTSELRRGVQLNGWNLAVINSYIADIHETQSDSQAIATWGGTGPYKIVNNYLEAAAENFLSGGATPAILSEIPSDIEFRHNFAYKQLSWKTADPSYAGIPWLIKNLFELKFAKRLLVSENLFYHNWAQGQTGRAILFTPRCQGLNGSCQVSGATDDDIEFSYNVIFDMNSAYEANGVDPLELAKQQRQNRLWLHDNVFSNINVLPGTNGWAHELLMNLVDFGATHNTTFALRTFLSFDQGSSNDINLTFENELGASGLYGVNCSGGGVGTLCLNSQALAYTFTGNVMFGNVKSTGYPATNQTCGTATCFPSTFGAVGFTNYSSCNATDEASLDVSGCALAPTSIYKNQATDGGDPGADIPTVISKTACVKSGANCN